MKEELNEEFLDLRRFDDATDPIELIQSITSNPSIEQDAFYIANLEDICNKHINWITRLPRVQPHYAIKCNTDPMLLKLLAFLGTGFDCASKGEIQTILDLGISQHRIIFANPCKQASHVKYAYKKGMNKCLTILFFILAHQYSYKCHFKFVFLLITYKLSIKCL